MKNLFIAALVMAFVAPAEARSFSQDYQRCVVKAEKIDGKAACVAREIVVQKKPLDVARKVID